MGKGEEERNDLSVVVVPFRVLDPYDVLSCRTHWQRTKNTDFDNYIM